MREAAFLMLGTINEHLLEAMEPQQLTPLLDQLIQLDLAETGRPHPFLQVGERELFGR
jgi:hypothetical protein